MRVPGVPIMDRYVLRAFVTSYLPLVVTFTLIYVIADAFPRVDRFLKSPDPFIWTVLRYYGVTLPVIFVRFGSFLTLAAGMFAVARLERNNEVMPIKACGLSIFRALVPVFACGALLGGLGVLDQELLIPRIASEIREATQYHKKKDVKPGILRDAAGNTLFAARYRQATRTLRWVTFRTHDEEGREAIVYYADSARWMATGKRAGYWLLEDGVIRDMRGTGTGRGTASAPRIPQKKIGYDEEGVSIETSIVPVDIESLWERESRLSFGELRDQFRRQRYLPRLRVQLHERITVPLGHLLLLLLGLPFVLREGGGRASVFIGMLALIVICAAYFLATFMCGELGAQGSVPPMAAAWTPVIFFGLIGIALFDRVRT